MPSNGLNEDLVRELKKPDRFPSAGRLRLVTPNGAHKPPTVVWLPLRLMLGAAMRPVLVNHGSAERPELVESNEAFMKIKAFIKITVVSPFPTESRNLDMAASTARMRPLRSLGWRSPFAQ